MIPKQAEVEWQSLVSTEQVEGGCNQGGKVGKQNYCSFAIIHWRVSTGVVGIALLPFSITQ